MNGNEGKEDQPRIVAAVGSAVTSLGGKGLAKAMEDAMSEAVHQAMTDGVSLDDSAEIRTRMEAARIQAKEDFLVMPQKTQYEVPG